MKNRSNFYPYQNKMVNHIKSNNGAGLFAGMSLGKSISTLTAYSELLQDFDVIKPLIIAPLRVAQTVWHNEAKDWEQTKHLKFSLVLGTLKERVAALKVDADFYIINRENVQWLGDYYQKKFPFDAIIIDESSSFKNGSSKRFRMLRKMLNLSKVKRTTILTGTPGNYMDLWSQTFILDKGQRLGKNIGMFRSAYFTPDYSGYNYTIKPGSEETINNKIKDIVLSLDTDDYLDLPPYMSEVVNIPMDSKLDKLYREFEEDMIYNLRNLEDDEESNIVAQSAAALSMKLLQFCSGAIYNDDKEVEIIHDLKFKALDDILEDNAKEQILIAYNFKHEKERILKRYPFAVEMDKKGDAVEKWNNGEIKMLVGHPASMGHGLNLHKSNAHLIVWFGFNYSLELYEQFNARLRRQGQKFPVALIHLAVGRVEYKLMRALADKKLTQDSIMNALKG